MANQNAVDQTGSKVRLTPIIFLITPLLKGSEMFELLLIGHFLTGLALGATSFIMIYVSECSTVYSRRLACCLVYMGKTIWLTVASIIGLPQVLGTDEAWPIAVGWVSLPAFLYFMFSLIFLHDSPTFLYLIKQDTIRAKKSFDFYYGLDAEYDKFEKEMKAEAVLEIKLKHVKLTEIYTLKHLRWSFGLSLVMGLAYAAGGAADFFTTYSTEILRTEFNYSTERAGYLSMCFVFLPCIIGVLLGLALAQISIPRRVQFFTGFLIADLGLLSIFLSIKFSLPAVCLTGYAVVMISWSSSFGAIGSYITGELCSQRIRAIATTGRLFVAASYATAQVVFYPPLQTFIGPWAILLCCFPDLFSFIFLFIFLPETMGKTVDEVAERWKEKHDDEKMSLF